MNRTTPRTAFSVLALSALALAACGSDDSGSTNAGTTNAGTTDTGASTGAPSADDLAGRAFATSEVTGHDLVDDSAVKLTFLDDAIAANAGCNSMNGGFQIVDGALAAGPFATTMMACEDALMEQDTWLSDFLSSAPTIALDGQTLTLTGGDTTMKLDEVQPAPIAGTTWSVTGTVTKDAVSSVPADSEASITIADDGIVAVNTGCNTGSGTVEVSDSTLTFGPLATTRMACEAELMELESTVTSVLSGEVSYEISGDALSLRTGTGDDEIGLELTATP